MIKAGIYLRVSNGMWIISATDGERVRYLNEHGKWVEGVTHYPTKQATIEHIRRKTKFKQIYDENSHVLNIGI